MAPVSRLHSGRDDRLQARKALDDYGALRVANELSKPMTWLVTLPWRMLLDVLANINEMLSDFLAYSGKPPSFYTTRLQVADYKMLVERLQKQDSEQKLELEELRDELMGISASKETLATKFKQLRSQNEQMAALLKDKDHNASSEFWTTHAALGLAAYALRWLMKNAGQQSEHRLMSVMICWPVAGLYLMWITKSSTSKMTPRLLVCLSCLTLGYVLHAAVENQLINDRASTCTEHASRSHV